MFESDDFDQVLSQFEFPEDISKLKSPEDKSECEASAQTNTTKICEKINVGSESGVPKDLPPKTLPLNKAQKQSPSNDIISPKHTKRKIIHSYFDHKSKRKFPGPAGLLTGGFEENKDETICQMELLSQDVDFSQTSLRGELFESPLWIRLLVDLKSWNLNDVDSIKTIKQQALSGNLHRRKAHTVTAFVEAVDRSVTDPLILMRDTTGTIKGTLHRDAWSTFSQYIASEYCAFVLWKPTILTTGSAFKKHYLNITLSNILAIYSSTVVTEEADRRPLPENYSIVYEDDFTVIKTDDCLQNIGGNLTLSSEQENGADLFEGLDGIFSDEIF